MLFDNGASIHCAKTFDGCLPGSFLADDDDEEISVGDANSALASQGSYLYTITFTDKRGTHKDMLLRRYHTPNVICDIFSEPQDVKLNQSVFTFSPDGRVWTDTDDVQMFIHMSSNGLGWLPSKPIVDGARIQELLTLHRKGLPESIPMCMASVNTE